PRTLAEVDLTAIVAALAAVETEDPGNPKDNRRPVQLERELAAAKARIELLERENHDLNSRLSEIAALASAAAPATLNDVSHQTPRPKAQAKPPRPLRLVT